MGLNQFHDNFGEINTRLTGASTPRAGRVGPGRDGHRAATGPIVRRPARP